MDLSTVFWTLLSLFYVGFSYFAALALIGGLVWRLVGYFRAPMPIPVASTPAPETEGGTLVRLLGDLLIFPNIPDYFVLVLLGLVAGTGILVSYWAHVYILDVKAFILGLMTLRPIAPPQHPLFLLHLTFVLILMVYFPFSKLLHAGGIFFSPTRAQPYQIQKAGKRYVNPLDQEYRKR